MPQGEQRSKLEDTNTLSELNTTQPHPLWLGALGVAMLAIGVIAISFPMVSSLAVELTIGSMFSIAGILTVVHAFFERSWKEFIWHLLIGLVYLIGGALMLLNPFSGLLALTLFLSAVLVADGVLMLVIGARSRSNRRWWWFIAAGIISVLLAFLILFNMRSGASLAVLGIIVGANFLFFGTALLAYSLGLYEDLNNEGDTESDAEKGSQADQAT